MILTGLLGAAGCAAAPPATSIAKPRTRQRSRIMRRSLWNVLLVLKEKLARQVHAQPALLAQFIHAVAHRGELHAVAREDHADDLVVRGPTGMLAQHHVAEERCLLPVDLRR